MNLMWEFYGVPVLHMIYLFLLKAIYAFWHIDKQT